MVSNLKGKVAEAQARFDANPSSANQVRLKAAQQDLEFAIRDGELLVEGIIPKDYIIVTPPK